MTNRTRIRDCEGIVLRGTTEAISFFRPRGFLLCSLLILTLVFPLSHAYALRRQQTKDSPTALSGLEEILKNPARAVERAVQFLSTPPEGRPAAGMEETETVLGLKRTYPVSPYHLSFNHLLAATEPSAAPATGLEEQIKTILLVGSDPSGIERVRRIVGEIFPEADIQTLGLPLDSERGFRGIDVAVLTEFDEGAKETLAEAHYWGIIPHVIAPDHWDDQLPDYELREALEGFRDAAGMEEVLNHGGAEQLAGVFQRTPDFSGLDQLRKAVASLPDPVRQRLAGILEAIRQAPDPARRWMALDQWIRTLNEELFAPQGRFVHLVPDFPRAGGVTLTASAYRPEGLEWWEVEGARIPVAYVQSIRNYEGTTGYAGPMGIALNLRAHRAAHKELKRVYSDVRAARLRIRKGQRPDPVDNLLLRLWPRPPSPVIMARFLLEETRREELRHAQMMRRVYPRLVELAVTGGELTPEAAADLLGLGSESSVRKMLAKSGEQALSAREILLFFLGATEKAAVLERLSRPAPESAGALYDLLNTASRFSPDAPKRELYADPSFFRTLTFWQTVNDMYHTLLEMGKAHREDPVAQRLTRMLPREIEELAARLWAKEFRPDAVPLTPPIRQVVPPDPTRARGLLDQMAQETQKGSGRPGTFRAGPSAELGAGMEESELVGLLDQRLRGIAAELPWLKEFEISLEDPKLRFAVHLGKSVQPAPGKPGSSSPHALTHLYNKVPGVKEAMERAGIRLLSIPLNVPEQAPEGSQDPLADIAQVRQALFAHPRVLLITATEPHKKMVGSWVSEPDPRVFPIRSLTNVLLIRDSQGKVIRSIGTNADGPSWVEQFKKGWGRQGDNPGTLEGKKVVVLGGWGGLGEALTLSILKERPRELVISELEHLKEAQEELPVLVAQWTDRSGPVAMPKILPASDPGNPEKDHPELLVHLRQADVIVNATGVGMDYGDARSPIRDPSVFRRPEDRPLTVIDSIYRTHPGEPRPVTPFLQQAWDQGVRDLHNGVGLFVRDFAWEAEWLVQTLTGTGLDPERIHWAMNLFAESRRSLGEAQRVLAAGYRLGAWTEVVHRAAVELLKSSDRLDLMLAYRLNGLVRGEAELKSIPEDPRAGEREFPTGTLALRRPIFAATYEEGESPGGLPLLSIEERILRAPFPVLAYLVGLAMRGWLGGGRIVQLLPEELDELQNELTDMETVIRRLSLATGMEEGATVQERPAQATATNRLASVAVENKVLILGPQAIGVLAAAAHLVPTDASSIPVAVVVENARQADYVKAWALDLPLVSLEVVDASLPAYGGDVERALEMTRRYYASEKGMAPIIARTLDDLPEIARLLGVPEPEAFARQAMLEAQRDLERHNL